MAEELNLNEQLTRVSEELQGQTTTRLVCDKLIEFGNIKIEDATKRDDNNEPLSITVTGEIVSNVLKPVIDLVNAKREKLLNAKEQILLQIESNNLKK